MQHEWSPLQSDFAGKCLYSVCWWQWVLMLCAIMLITRWACNIIIAIHDYNCTLLPPKKISHVCTFVVCSGSSSSSSSSSSSGAGNNFQQIIEVFFSKKIIRHREYVHTAIFFVQAILCASIVCPPVSTWFLFIIFFFKVSSSGERKTTNPNEQQKTPLVKTPSLPHSHHSSPPFFFFFFFCHEDLQAGIQNSNLQESQLLQQMLWWRKEQFRFELHRHMGSFLPSLLPRGSDDDGTHAAINAMRRKMAQLAAQHSNIVASCSLSLSFDGRRPKLLVLLLWCCCCCMVFVCSDLEIWWRLRGSKLAMIVGAVEKPWERWGKALQRRLGVFNHHHGWEQQSSDGFVLLSYCSFQLQVCHLSLSLSLSLSCLLSHVLLQWLFRVFCCCSFHLCIWVERGFDSLSFWLSTFFPPKLLVGIVL